MTPEQQRIKIAEVCGWLIDDAEMPPSITSPTGKHFFPDYSNLSCLPNYSEDLNAMHEAEKMLNAEQSMEYGRLIHEMVHSPRHWAHINFDLIHSTPQQRSEAFLRTLGLWED